MPTMANWVLLIAATAYLTWVVVNTEGPYGLFRRIRDLNPSGVLPHEATSVHVWRKVFRPVTATLETIGEMASCYWCASFWMALVTIALFLYIPELVWVLALAGFINALRTVYQHVSLPRENKVRIDTADYLRKNYSSQYAAKYLELGDVQAAFQTVNNEDD